MRPLNTRWYGFVRLSDPSNVIHYLRKRALNEVHSLERFRIAVLEAGKLAETRQALPQANVHMMIQRRAKTAGLRTKISAHSFRATGITTYLENGGKLDIAQAIAGHESAKTTGLYDRRDDTVALDEVERIAF